MIILFKQTRKYYNQNNKILHLALQSALLIGTTIVTRNRNFLSVPCDYGTTEPSNSVPESSDKHAQLLTAGNFEKIFKLGEKFELCVIIFVIVHKNNITQTCTI